MKDEGRERVAGGGESWGSTSINEIEEVRKFHLRLAWDPTANNSRMSKQMMEQASTRTLSRALSLSSPCQRERLERVIPFLNVVYSLSSNIFQLQLTFSLALSLSIALFCTSSLALSLHTHSRFGGGKLFGLGSTFEFFIDGGLSRTFPDRCALIVSFELLRTGQRCRIVWFDLIRLSKATALSTDWMQRIYIAKIQHTHPPPPSRCT